MSQAPFSLTLFEPDIPGNAGAIMRLCACLAVPLHVVEPCGFLLDDRRLRCSGMDYLDGVDLSRHADWHHFVDARPKGRKILATAHGDTLLQDFTFEPGDHLIFGRESAGAPPEIHEACDARLRLPLRATRRSINVAQAASIFAFEASRQLDWLNELGSA